MHMFFSEEWKLPNRSIISNLTKIPNPFNNNNNNNISLLQTHGPYTY